MNQLEEARRVIDHVDRQMAALFEQRMEAVRHVAEFKATHGLPVLNREREEEVVSRNLALLEDPALYPYYETFIRDLMALSRRYQAELLELLKNNRV
ncbi:protein containing Chorismate mutase domain protein [gut metagenome]|uniref:Protein containing Chorismate mutase domain protein n=1 Tax=gut metagenome TaxID=749906 RepID=J9GDZ5_9ZZZZ